MEKRNIWKTSVRGVGPYVIENKNGVIATVRNNKDAQEISNIPKMIGAINEVLNYLSEKPDVLKLSKTDMIDILNSSLMWNTIED